MDSMYSQLRSLPLFQGVDDGCISQLVEQFPFHFLKFKPGETIVNAGDQCQHVRFVVSGSVRLETESKVLRIKLLQTLNAPEALGPDCLFGIDNSYPFTAVAGDQCGILQLRKSDYVKVLQTNKVFLFNILNFLSSNSQRHAIALQYMRQGSIAERFAREINDLTTQHSTQVTLEFRQRDLCTLLGTQRNSLIAALDQMAHDGIIEYTPNSIQIKDLRALNNLYKNPNF